MSDARPSEGARIAVRRTESFAMSDARPSEGARLAVRRTEISQ